MKLREFSDRIIASVKSLVAREVGALSVRLDGLSDQLKALPAGPKGEPGASGKDGRDGVDGKDGIDGKDGGPGKDGRDGVDGKDGAPGRDGKDGAAGENGAPGKDGASVTLADVMPVLEAAFSKWAIEVERRAMDLFQRTAEAMPVPKDGLSVDDMAVEHDGDGKVTFRFLRGDLRKEFTIRLPRFKDCGVYREGTAHQAGDGVTYGGSFWIAQRDDPEGKPDGGNGHWRLAVKRGRDGKDGK